jgi:opacity protein-like surface antigen
MKSLALAMAAAALLSVSAIAQDSQSTAQAEAAASAWLTLVDAGRYSDSWEQAAGLFKSKISAPTWASAVGGVRAPFGALKSRRLQSSVFTHTLPGAPDGNYVVIKYSSRFENKADAVETVTPLQEKDGTWHVSGYYVK